MHLCTSGSQGIGYGCTYTLLKHNISKLFIISQSTDVAADAINSIRGELGDDAASKVQWLGSCDLSDWKAVGQTALKIRSQTDRLDILINNAAKGILTAGITSYGVDEHMATNHFGRKWTLHISTQPLHYSNVPDLSKKFEEERAHNFR